MANFPFAVNDYYKPENGGATQFTTYYNCSNWLSTKVAATLEKGRLVEVSGRIYGTAYSCADGMANASLNCHGANLKIYGWPKEIAVIRNAPSTPADDPDEVPFSVLLSPGVPVPKLFSNFVYFLSINPQ